MKKSKKLTLTLVICLAAVLLTGCQQETVEYQRLEMSFFGTFDTLITIKGYAQDQEAFDRVADEAKDQFVRFHRVYDAYNEYEGVANLYVLNRDGGEKPVAVEPELMDLLVYYREHQPVVGSTVNVAMGAVLSLWHEHREDGLQDPENASVPSQEALDAAAMHIDFSDVILDEEAGTVAFADPELRLDVGSVAKGYATERVAEWMAQSEMPSFLISAGGNVRVGDPPMDGRSFWNVGIQNPDGADGSEGSSEYIDVVYAANTSIVTSGDYQRVFVVDGVAYHHIISPATLAPARYFRSVTVVCEDSGLADLLSTALFVLPYEESRALADSLEGVEAHWVLNNGADSREMTDGMRAMLQSTNAAQ